MRLRTVLAAVLTACVLAPPSLAADCSLKLVNIIPLTLAENNTRALVPVTIDGTTEIFLLDTGGFATQIEAAAATELKLHPAESGVKMLDLYGHASETAARADTFALGRMERKDAVFPILPMTFGNGEPFAGLLAADYMGRYDVELDFTGGKMNYFSPDHCQGQVVYWPAPAIAVVPIDFRGHDMILQVTLDGQAVRAIVDTGAPRTTLNAAAAKRLFGVTADSPGANVLHEEGGKKFFEYAFKKLSFEGMEVGNPRVEILPDLVGSKDPNNGYVTGSRVQRVDDPDSGEPAMLIGMNILSKLHLFIAFSEKKLYVTPAGVPAAPGAR